MKFHRNITASVLALSLAACSQGVANTEVQKDFICKPTAFGYCATTYVGAKTPAEALAYAQDSRAAVNWIMAELPDVKAVHYEPRYGRLILQMNPGGRRDVGDANYVLDHFNEQNLVVESVKFASNAMGPIGSPVTNDADDNGAGKARFNALRSHKVGNTYLAYSVFSTSKSIKDGAFQDQMNQDVIDAQGQLPDLPVGMRLNSSGL